VKAELDPGYRLLVFYGPDDIRGPRFQRRLVQGLARLIRAGFTNVLALDGFEVDGGALAAAVGTVPWFLSDRWPRHYLPAGPMLILTTPSTQLSKSMWTTSGESHARIVFLPNSAADPNLPDVPLRRRHGGRQLALLELLERLAR
jgi:hypothetical protein